MLRLAPWFQDFVFERADAMRKALAKHTS